MEYPSELFSELRSALEGFRESGESYPCNEDLLVDRVSRSLSLPEDLVRKAVRSDASLSGKTVKKGGPRLVVFTGDEKLVFGITGDSVRKALEMCGGKASAARMASQLGFGKSGEGSVLLKEELAHLVRNGAIFRVGTRFSLESPVPGETEVIEALSSLKRNRKYPALPGEIKARIGRKSVDEKKLKETLRRMGKKAILTPSKRGRYGAYMLAGEDPRFARKPDNKLKFELLEEIEDLRTQILEMKASTASQSDALPAESPSRTVQEESRLEDRVLKELGRIARKSNRRTVELWEIRAALHDLDSGDLDRSLESLGRAWSIELQPVQDSTKLSDRQRDAMLRLSDGTMVVAVAVDPV